MNNAQLSADFQSSEPITLEFVDLIRETFSFYGELRSRFYKHLPQQLRPGDFSVFLAGDLKIKLFTPAFCERIPESLKSVRRALMRLDDLRKAHPGIPPFVNDLKALAAIAERVESLYQLHWEYYRYPSHVGEGELLAVLLEIDRISYQWDIYLEGFSRVRALVAALKTQDCPEGSLMLTASYQDNVTPAITAPVLLGVTRLLEGIYRFVCGLRNLEPSDHPLVVLHVETGSPCLFHLAVPNTAHGAFRTFLHYLPLKDLVQADQLLKFVVESLEKEYSPAAENMKGKPPGKALKELIALTKELPPQGRLTLADSSSGTDPVGVMGEFIGSLERQNIPYESLLKAADKLKKKAAMRSGDELPIPAPIPVPAVPPISTPLNAAPAMATPSNAPVAARPQPAAAPGSRPFPSPFSQPSPIPQPGKPAVGKEHVTLLTERDKR